MMLDANSLVGHDFPHTPPKYSTFSKSNQSLMQLLVGIESPFVPIIYSVVEAIIMWMVQRNSSIPGSLKEAWWLQTTQRIFCFLLILRQGLWGHRNLFTSIQKAQEM